MFDSASSFSALVGIAVDVGILFMALLSFVESAPRAYRLKVSNAALSISTSGGTIPGRVATGVIDAGPLLRPRRVLYGGAYRARGERREIRADPDRPRQRRTAV